MIIKEFLYYATDFLKKANIETPALEAGVVLCHVLKCDRTFLYAHDDVLLKDCELEELYSILDKRAKNIPLQYLLGETEFMSLTFVVTPAVLIPRQDTEVLVEKCIELLGSSKSTGTKRVLDMCTGSGCIAISIARYFTDCNVVACDISEAALEIAKTNSERNGTLNKLKLLYGDLFEALGNEDRFDIIVSNPPYIETNTIEGLQKEVKEHEPMLALDGGADGLEFYRRIIAEAPRYMKEGGYLLFEIGFNQSESIKKLMQASFEDISVYKDYGGNDRIVEGRIKNK